MPESGRSKRTPLTLKLKREQDIADALARHNNEVHLRGETLPIQQQVYHVKVVTALLRAGIPLSKLDSFRDILEENAYRLTDRRHMFDLVPFILKEEEARIKNDIAGKHLSVIFDGTSRLGEALAVIVRFVGEDWTLEQRLIRMQMLSKSMAGQEIHKYSFGDLWSTTRTPPCFNEGLCIRQQLGNADCECGIPPA